MAHCIRPRSRFTSPNERRACLLEFNACAILMHALWPFCKPARFLKHADCARRAVADKIRTEAGTVTSLNERGIGVGTALSCSPWQPHCGVQREARRPGVLRFQVLAFFRGRCCAAQGCAATRIDQGKVSRVCLAATGSSIRSYITNSGGPSLAARQCSLSVGKTACM